MTESAFHSHPGPPGARTGERWPTLASIPLLLFNLSTARNIQPLSREALVQAGLSMWVASLIPFPARCLPDAPLGSEYADDIAGSWGVQLVDRGRTGTRNRPFLQGNRVDCHDSRPGQGITATTAPESAGHSNASSNPGLWSGRIRAGSIVPGGNGLSAGRSTAPSIGRQARERAGSLTGRERVEILAVPDDERVIVRREDGSESRSR